MLKGRIDFEARTLDDAEDAIKEALSRILGGNTSGFDRNEDSSFTFEVGDSGEVSGHRFGWAVLSEG